jgi:CRISPR system Cascade subunit CasB
MTKSSNPTSRGGIALSWWANLQRTRADETPNPNADPAALARMRRVTDSLEVATDEAVLALARRLYPGLRPRAHDFDRKLSRIGVLAVVLAHVRRLPEDERGRRPSVASTVGPRKPGKPETAKLSALRFRRLLAARTDQEIMIGFRRLVAISGGAINVADLAESILDWNEGERGERVRTRWAYEYYGAAIATPDQEIVATPIEEGHIQP